MPNRPLLIALSFSAFTVAAVSAQSPQWSLVKPSNTGIPGEAIELVRWAPGGDLWVAARWPNYQEGGIGKYDLETEIWSGWSNIDSPLPSEYFNDLDFDASGTAWISTESGLVRLEGENWTIYDPSNSPLEDYSVQGTSIAANGDIWINSTNALWRFDGNNEWTRYAVGSELPWEPPWVGLSAVFVASNGHVWIGNDVDDGVAEYDGTSWTLRGEELGPLSGFVEDQFHNIWMMGHPVTGLDAFYRWDGSDFTTFPMETPTTMAFDADDGMLYLANWHGEVRRTPNGGQTIHTLITGLNIVVSLAPDPVTSDVWIGTIGALGHFDADGTLLRDYNTYNTGVPDYWVDRNVVDRDGYLWAASGEGGLSRFDGARWRNWGNHNAGAEPYPFAGNEPMGTALQDSSGMHWFGGNGIARWDAATGTFDGFWNWENNPGMWPSKFQFLAEDGFGNLFALDDVWGDVFRFDRARMVWVLEPVYPYGPVGLPGMFADSTGTVFIVDWFGMHRWDGSGWDTVPLPYTDFFYDLGGINAVALGPDDDIWFGTVHGLVHWDRDVFTVYDTSNSPLPHGLVPGVAVREDGLVGLSSVWYGPFDGEAAAILIDGDPSVPQNWSMYHYGESPLHDYDLATVAFDAAGDFRVHTKNDGTAVVHVGHKETLQLMATQPIPGGPTTRFLVTGATPGASIDLVQGYARSETPAPLPDCDTGALSIEGVQVVASAIADAEGVARIDLEPSSAVRLLRPTRRDTFPGLTRLPARTSRPEYERGYFQALELARCAVSPVLPRVLE